MVMGINPPYWLMRYFTIFLFAFKKIMSYNGDWCNKISILDIFF